MHYNIFRATLVYAESWLLAHQRRAVSLDQKVDPILATGLSSRQAFRSRVARLSMF
ncbi:hypothetical protein BYT27DRAFT_7201535, partial [Phlegmacium glaucopus]